MQAEVGEPMPFAITRKVGPAIRRCQLTHLERTPIDVARAVEQHAAYERALAGLGYTVVGLPEEPGLPDSVFVEDAAVVVPGLAVITRPGAPSRRPETAAVEAALARYRPTAAIEAPGTLDGGDVLVLGRRVLVGLSQRTNREGIGQLRALLSGHGFSVEALPVNACLHLKSAATLVGPETVLVNPGWVDVATFAGMRTIETDPDEPHAANALRAGGAVIYPTAFPRTATRLEEAGVALVRVDVSELAKAEGGVTCCSLIVED